jgi:argininosuccinate synthase
MKQRVVLAYSGGPASSAVLSWLLDRQAEVVAVTLDVGQGGEFADVRDRALSAGAVRCHVLDMREDFARGFILPALTAGAFARRPATVAAWLTRPLIAKTLVEIARMENTTTIAHGGSGEDAAALSSSVRMLDPRLTVLAHPAPPVDRLWELNSTIWGRSIHVRGTDRDAQPQPDDLFRLTRPAAEAPDRPARVEIAFEQGRPVAVNGIAMPIGELIESLTTIAGAHGVGRTDRHDIGPGDQRARVIHEAPAAHVLHLAHDALEVSVSPPELSRFTPMMAAQYADLIAHGLWASPLREACDAFVRRIQQRVSGTVRLTLFKGEASIDGCSPGAPQPIEDPSLVATGR